MIINEKHKLHCRTVYDVNASLLVIPGTGKTRSGDDDVIVPVTVDVTSDDMPAHDVIQPGSIF